MVAAAIECLPVAFSRVVNTTDTTPGTVVSVSCPAGQMLRNRKYNMTASCSAGGQWLPNIPDCKGNRFTSAFFFIFVQYYTIRYDE